MNKYIAFYRGAQKDFVAETSRAAQLKAAAYFGARKAYNVTVVLVERADGSAVVHSTAAIG